MTCDPEVSPLATLYAYLRFAKSFALFHGLTEEYVDPVKRHRAAANDGAGGNRAPKDVGSCKLPDCEQRGEHRDQNAEARYPE